MTTLKDVQWTIPAPVRRLHRMINNRGLEEIFPTLAHAPESELQEVRVRYVNHGEDHTKLGIFKDFNPSTLPSVAFEEVKNVNHDHTKLFPLLNLYFETLSIREIVWVINGGRNVALDDFRRCRFFFRFVGEVVEKGRRLVLMQDEKQTVAVFVHIRAIRLLDTDPKFGPAGTEHQIHFVHQAHERLLDKSFVAEHDKAWSTRYNYLRPSFIVPLRCISPYDQLHILREIAGNVTPASERAPRNPDET